MARFATNGEKYTPFAVWMNLSVHFFGVVDCLQGDFKKKPFKTKAGKYILIEVKE